ncbi:SET domain-containing protein, partial [Periconia macrospinosa]
PANLLDNEYYEVRHIPGKGYGSVAKQDIKCGTRILADEPLLIVPIANYGAKDIEEAFGKLTQDQKDLYLSLSCGQEENKDGSAKFYDNCGEIPPVVRIFQINCMEWNDGAAVFPKAARFNHSCVPNATFSWHPTLQKEVVHAIQDIPKGEEITLTYCGMTGDITLRTWLLEHYGFKCQCSACGSEASRDRRFRIDELLQSTRPYRGYNLEAGNQQVTKQMLQLVVLCKEEGEYSIRVSQLLLELAILCERTNDWQHGLEFAASAVKMKRDCQGADFPDHGKYTEVFKRIYGKSKEAAAAAAVREGS